MTYTHTQNLPNIELINYTQDDVDQAIPIINTDDKCTGSWIVDNAHIQEQNQEQINDRDIQKFMANPAQDIKSLVNALRFNILHECVDQHEANPNTHIDYDLVHASDRVTNILNAFAQLTNQDMIQYIADNFNTPYYHEAFQYFGDDGEQHYYSF